MRTDGVALLGVKGGPALYPKTAASNGFRPTSSLLHLDGRRVLVDAGLGAAIGVTAAGVALTELDAIVVTHLHSDHYLELGALLHTAWCAGLKRPLRVIGPSGLEAYWRHFLAAMAFDIALRIEDEGRPDLAGLVRLERLSEGAAYDLDGLALTALLNVHPPIDESFALRFDAPDGRAVCFSGDTAPHPPLAAFARGVDLLVHEAMLPAGVDCLVARAGNGDERLRRHIERSHSSAAEAGRIATAAGAKALALHHLLPGDDRMFTEADWIAAARETWAGPLHIGRDGLVVAL